MNFQEKVVETTADLRQRAATSLNTLKLAGHELNQVARRHLARLLQQNSSLMREAGSDISALARETYSQLAGHSAKVARKVTPASRKRATAKAG